MASDLQNKSLQTDGVETGSVAKKNPNEISTASKLSSFTAEQQRILGEVLRLILSRRRARLTTEREA